MRATLEERFWAKVDKSAGADECWIWTGCARQHLTHRYGHILINGKKALAHRVAWELEHGCPPTSDMCICHACNNASCVNPRHLFEATQAQNVSDMVEKRRHAGQVKTECKRGHAFTVENTYFMPSGGRSCRTCNKAKNAAYQRRVRAESAAQGAVA